MLLFPLGVKISTSVYPPSSCVLTLIKSSYFSIDFYSSVNLNLTILNLSSVTNGKLF